ncbi:MAG: hypothetical protein AB7I79_21885 [Rhizobiaceae bacterium]
MARNPACGRCPFRRPSVPSYSAASAPAPRPACGKRPAR